LLAIQGGFLLERVHIFDAVLKGGLLGSLFLLAEGQWKLVRGSMSTELLKTIQDLVDPILNDFGLECVDLEFKREGHDQVLRILIDKPDGVSLDDCINVSREVSAILEVEDPISKAYRLEVSSPGLDRPLKRAEDFERFSGQSVKVKTFTMIDPDGRGHKRKTFRGELLGLTDDGICILQTDKKGGKVVLPFSEIAKANLEPEF